METSNNRISLSINDLKFNNLKTKQKINTNLKKRILENIRIGRKIPARAKYQEKKITSFCFYLDNFFVYTNPEDISDITKLIWNNAKKDIPESITIDKEIKFSNPSHVEQRKLGRQISLLEIIMCLKYGKYVPDYSKGRNGYVHYDRLYFYEDLCVVAVERKDHWDIRTSYRTSPINDTGFLQKLEGYLQQLSSSGNETARLYSRTALRKYFMTKEFQDLCLVKELRKSDRPISKKLKAIRDRIKFWGLWNLVQHDQRKFDLYAMSIQDNAMMKAIECGLITYSTNPDEGVSMKEFQPIPHHEYQIEFEFAVNKKKEISREQKRSLKIMGINIEKIEHNLQILEKNNTIMAKLSISMNNFCANDQPWAHGEYNGTQ